MPAFDLSRVRVYWRRLTRLDRIALAVVFLYALVWSVELFSPRAPGKGLGEPFVSFLRFFCFISVAYLLIRLLSWARERLLWSLRNRLIVAYVFIAVVPVLLVLAMVLLSARIIYSQLGGYLLFDDLQRRVEEVADAADAVASSAAAALNATKSPGISEAVSAHMASLESDLPGLEIRLNVGQEILARHGGPGAQRFAGLVQTADSLSLMAVVARGAPGKRIHASATAPVTPALLEKIAPYLGPVQLLVTRPASRGETQDVVYRFEGRDFRPSGRIGTRRRALQPPANWFDYEIQGLSKLDAVSGDQGESDTRSRPVFAVFSARPSQLNHRIFSSLGELSGVYFQLLIAVGVLFLVLEVAALITGIVLTRTITHAVAELYRATQYVRAGDLSHRVRVQRKDQLGELGESFNSMTSSISALIDEQRQRQRLENELTIAREVQEQLFPQTLPSLPGIQLQAICRAARMVSGDYYDFIPLGPTRLGIALADISGKGISAALLMASLQAALRSQVMGNGNLSMSTAELVSRLNLHLYRNTADDRYATLFYADYDTATRTLRYTNAGHLPPLYLAGGKATKLDEGGMVVGLFDDCVYEQGIIQAEPGGVLLAYSDGLTEPENVYGEEFGSRRLLDVALRHRDANPKVLAETLMQAAEEWGGTAEQADDMTIIVARLE